MKYILKYPLLILLILTFKEATILASRPAENFKRSKSAINPNIEIETRIRVYLDEVIDAFKLSDLSAYYEACKDAQKFKLLPSNYTDSDYANSTNKTKSLAQANGSILSQLQN